MVQTLLLFDTITNEKTLKFLQLDIFTRHPDLQVREKYRLIHQFHLFRKTKRIKTYFTMTVRICVICLCQKIFFIKHWHGMQIITSNNCICHHQLPLQLYT